MPNGTLLLSVGFAVYDGAEISALTISPGLCLSKTSWQTNPRLAAMLL